MICSSVLKFCKGDISLIENYDEAINSEEMWDCHHKLAIELHKTREELKEMGLYYNRPASELIFLTHSEHSIIHKLNGVKLHKDNVTKEGRKKISIALKGKRTGENNPFYGKHHSETTKRRIREKLKGRKYGERNKEVKEKLSQAAKERWARKK